MQTILKRIETPDETRHFKKGRFEIVNVGGTIVDLTPGTVFYIPPIPHDSWVVGDEPYVSLHFLGADHYAK